MNLDRFKCKICGTIPTGSVYECFQKHLSCSKCALNNHYLCSCLENLTAAKENRLEAALNEYASKTLGKCDYFESGCSYECIQAEVLSHVPECKYRPYKCVGVSLGLWSCDWLGRQIDIVDHLQSVHLDLAERFAQYQSSSIPFLEHTTYGTLNLIQAYDRSFLFYFFADHEDQKVHIAIILLGKRKTAKRFYYDVVIKSPTEVQRKIKFTEKCISDSDALSAPTVFEMSHVISVTHSAIKAHLKEDNIHFTIRLMEIGVKVDPKLEPPKVMKKIPPKLPPPKKDPKKTNLKKVVSGIPTEQGQGAPKPKPEDSEKLSLDLGTSINKSLPVPTKEPPCLTPSINKPENANVFQFPKKDPIFQRSMSECQVYKDTRSKQYIQQLYPTSSLSKPTLKK